MQHLLFFCHYLCSFSAFQLRRNARADWTGGFEKTVKTHNPAPLNFEKSNSGRTIMGRLLTLVVQQTPAALLLSRNAPDIVPFALDFKTPLPTVATVSFCCVPGLFRKRLNQKLAGENGLGYFLRQ
jgi:hypothetical protein